MLAIEFSRVCALNERSSENEMDWIIKTNSILSLSLSSKETVEILPRHKNNTHDESKRERWEYAREKKNTSGVFSLVAPLFYYIIVLSLSLSETSFCAETKGKILAKKGKKELN